MTRLLEHPARPRPQSRRPSYPRLLGLGVLIAATACGEPGGEASAGGPLGSWDAGVDADSASDATDANDEPEGMEPPEGGDAPAPRDGGTDAGEESDSGEEPDADAAGFQEDPRE